MVGLVAKRKPRPKRHDVFDGKKLRAERNARDYTQQQVADLAGIHVIDVSRYERDEVEPSLAVAVKLAAVLGVELKQLLKE